MKRILLIALCIIGLKTYAQNCVTPINFGTNTILENFFLDADNYTEGRIRGNAGNLTINDLVLNGEVCEENTFLVTYLNLAGGTDDPAGPGTFTGIGLTSLEGIQFFENLEFLYVQRNSLTELNLSQNLNLIDVRAFLNNTITTIDFTNLIELSIVGLIGNQIVDGDFSTNPAIDTIDISRNELTSLTLHPSATPSWLRLEENSAIAELDISGGRDVDLIRFATMDTPSLTCIQVTDLTQALDNAANLPGWEIGDTNSFTENGCSPPTATVSLPCCAGSELDEFGGTITGTVDLTDGLGSVVTNDDCCNDIVVEIGLQEGTAVAADLNEVFPITVNIVPGSSSGTFTISAFDDRIIENIEAASLVVNTGTGYIADTATADFTINDNEQCCGFDAILEGSGGTEGGQSQFTVRLQTNGETPEAALTNGTGSDFVFPIAYTNGTSEDGDYATTIVQVAIPDGSSEAMFAVDLLEDVDTDDETFTVAIGLPTGIPSPPGDPNLVPTGGVEVTIIDNDTTEPTATVSLPCCAGSELDEFGGSITATVSLTDIDGNPFSNPDCCNDIMVEIGLVEGTAVAADLNEVFPIMVNIAPGSDSGNFAISALDDSIIEDIEGASLVVNSGTGYVADTSTADFTINDNEQCCGFDAVLEGPVTGVEGDDLSFTLTLRTNGETPERELTNGTVSDFVFPINYTDIGTIAGDYSGPTEVSIVTGNSSGTFTVSLVDDPDPEPDEDFTITLGIVTGIPDPPGDPSMVPVSGITVTIIDNDTTEPTAVVSLPCCADSELDEFGGTITGTVELTDGLGSVVTNDDCCNDIVVEIGLQEGTAVAADLNEVFPITVNIVPGSSSGTFTISAFDDRIIENIEAASLVVNTGTGYIADTATADFTINDNEQCCGVEAVLEGVDGTEGGQADFTVRLQTDTANGNVVLENGTGADFTFDVDYTPDASDTAEAGDFDTLVVTVSIPNGATEGTFTVQLPEEEPAAPDTDDETFTVSLLNPQGIPGSVGTVDLTNATVQVTITDNDTNTSGIVVDPISGLETSEDGTTADFTVVLQSQPTTDVVLNMMVLAASADEISLDQTTLTFTSINWNEPQTVTITGQDDTEVDGDQDFQIDVSVNVDLSDDMYDTVTTVSVNGVNLDNDTEVDNNTPDVSTDTFTVIILENSCLGQANGELRLQVNNTSDTFNVSFDGQDRGTIAQGGSLNFTDLEPSEYTLVLTASGFDGWQQEFKIQLAGVQPISIPGFSIDRVNSLARLRLEGSESYTVNINGQEEIYEGFDPSLVAYVEISVEKGFNRIVVKGEKACQGILEKEFVVGQVLAHPVPVNDRLFLEGLPEEQPLTLQLYDLSGRLVGEWKNDKSPPNMSLEMVELRQGIYMLRISGKGYEENIQLLKN